jgi:tRNA A-37 threonylcarbamoyl transferase component Bud32
VTGDRFIAPTRAPHELRASIRLAEAGVATPEVVAYATYPAGIFRRSDVATREIVGGRDLAELLGVHDDVDVASVIQATGELLRALERAGARHPDLNAGNVLVSVDGNNHRALVLDVDRVVFGTRGDRDIGAATLRRLVRSLEKLRAHPRIAMSDDQLATLASAAGHVE